MSGTLTLVVDPALPSDTVAQLAKSLDVPLIVRGIPPRWASRVTLQNGYAVVRETSAGLDVLPGAQPRDVAALPNPALLPDSSTPLEPQEGDQQDVLTRLSAFLAVEKPTEEQALEAQRDTIRVLLALTRKLL
jgi:hypothetical protein